MWHSYWKLGKWLYGIPLSITGLIYIFRPQGTVESLTSFIPGDLWLIYVTGSLWLILGLAIAFDFFARYAMWGVFILLFIVQMMVHIPAAYTGEHLNIVWFELLRDLSLMGGALIVLGS